MDIRGPPLNILHEYEARYHNYPHNSEVINRRYFDRVIRRPSIDALSVIHKNNWNYTTSAELYSKTINNQRTATRLIGFGFDDYFPEDTQNVGFDERLYTKELETLTDIVKKCRKKGPMRLIMVIYRAAVVSTNYFGIFYLFHVLTVAFFSSAEDRHTTISTFGITDDASFLMAWVLSIVETFSLLSTTIMLAVRPCWGRRRSLKILESFRHLRDMNNHNSFDALKYWNLQHMRYLFESIKYAIFPAISVSKIIMIVMTFLLVVTSPVAFFLKIRRFSYALSKSDDNELSLSVILILASTLTNLISFLVPDTNREPWMLFALRFKDSPLVELYKKQIHWKELWDQCLFDYLSVFESFIFIWSDSEDVKVIEKVLLTPP
jgi:hypothetical protein